MWFKNRTGVINEILHKDTIKRLLKDKNFTEIKKPTKKKKEVA